MSRTPTTIDLQTLAAVTGGAPGVNTSWNTTWNSWKNIWNNGTGTGWWGGYGQSAPASGSGTSAK